MSQLQANDSSWNRRISAGFGAGVLSWNGQSGDVIGTLANIYAFGLGHSAATDNLFNMPAYQWIFAGENTATKYAVGAFEKEQVENFSVWNYVQRAGVHSRNYAVTFNLYSMNDPTWVGGEGALAPVQTWVTEDVRYGNATSISPDEIVDQIPMAAGLWQWQDGSTWYFDAANPFSSFSLAAGKRVSRSHQFRADYLLGDSKWIDSVDSYGNRQVTQVVDLNAVHGLVPGDLVQVDYVAGSLQPDDGIGYFLATGSLQDLNGTFAKGWFAVRSVAAGGSDGAWYTSLGASKALADGGMVEWLRGYTDVGAKVLVGGLQLPDIDVSTFPLSDAGTARVAYDNDTGQAVISRDGTAYTVFGQMVSAVSPVLDLTVSNDGVAFDVPLKRAGWFLVPTYMSLWATTDPAGTATSDLVVSVGNDAGFSNMASMDVAAIVVTTATAKTQVQVNPGPQPNAAGIDAATEIKIKTTPPAGITAFTGRIVFQGTWVKS